VYVAVCVSLWIYVYVAVCVCSCYMYVGLYVYAGATSGRTDGARPAVKRNLLRAISPIFCQKRPVASNEPYFLSKETCCE